jgi:hypothetical protein
MQQHFLPTGRVHFLPGTDYRGENRVTSRLGGAAHEIRVRKKVVDTRYLEGAIPATSPPPFRVADGVRVVTPGELARLDLPGDRYVVIGGGKTALDTSVWLLEQGVAPAAIQWIRPREGWWLNRTFQQPHTLLPDLYRGGSLQIEASAQATSLDDLFARLEAAGVFLRIDPAVTPTMFHGAIVSESELALLRTIEDVVRLGHVRAIAPDHIELTGGRIPTDARTVHVHCAARGLARPAVRPIFTGDRIAVQPFFFGFASHQFALLGAIEALVTGGDDEKNRLAQPIPYWDDTTDYPRVFLATLLGDRARAAHPALAAWMKQSRLNPTSRISAYLDDPRVADSRSRIKRHGGAAALNLTTLIAGR